LVPFYYKTMAVNHASLYVGPLGALTNSGTIWEYRKQFFELFICVKQRASIFPESSLLNQRDFLRTFWRIYAA